MTDTQGQKKITGTVLMGNTFSLRCRNPKCFRTCVASGHGIFIGFQCQCGWTNNVDTTGVPSSAGDGGISNER